MFIDLVFLKIKPIAIGVIYKPPNQTRFLEQIITEFERLTLKTEYYITEVLMIIYLLKGLICSINQAKLRSFSKNFRRILYNILNFV